MSLVLQASKQRCEWRISIRMGATAKQKSPLNFSIRRHHKVRSHASGGGNESLLLPSTWNTVALVSYINFLSCYSDTYNTVVYQTCSVQGDFYRSMLYFKKRCLSMSPHDLLAACPWQNVSDSSGKQILALNLNKNYLVAIQITYGRFINYLPIAASLMNKLHSIETVSIFILISNTLQKKIQFRLNEKDCLSLN